MKKCKKYIIRQKTNAKINKNMLIKPIAKNKTKIK